jgi:L-threonylcarbamoyladenylate synthase
MMKRTVHIKCDEYNEEALNSGSLAIQEGHLVIFPTETVYGLGADATSDIACKRIYEAKGRPGDNPLIVHFSSIEEIKKYCYWEEITKNEELEKLWPGPLTVIVRKKSKICNTASANLQTVGVRIPDCNFTRELIARSGVPLAAPSANTSGKPSATKAEHVIDELGGKVDVIFFGEQSKYGIESTVIMPNGDDCKILRPGAYAEEELLKVFKTVSYPMSGDKVISPGNKYRHYSPEKPLYRANPADLIEYAYKHKDCLPIVSKELAERIDMEKIILGTLSDPYSISRNLYDSLRSLDASNKSSGIIENFPEVGYFFSIMNRIKKASVELSI